MKSPERGIDIDEGTFGDFVSVVTDGFDRARENPGMAAQQRLFLAASEVYLRDHFFVFFGLGVCSSRS